MGFGEISGALIFMAPYSTVAIAGVALYFWGVFMLEDKQQTGYLLLVAGTVILSYGQLMGVWRVEEYARREMKL